MTASEVKAAFSARGVTFTAWAEKHGFPRNKVYLVLNGQLRGNYGQAYKMAKMLGMKDGRIEW